VIASGHSSQKNARTCPALGKRSRSRGIAALQALDCEVGFKIKRETFHFRSSANHRKREWRVGSKITSSGALLSRPVAESDWTERSASGLKRVSNVWLSFTMPRHTR
jgi:hypothetical protein